MLDPKRCRLWSGHAALHAPEQALNRVACDGLLKSLRRQGRQEVPAIVRRLANDPAHEFEVVCGARRHWAVAFLRARDLPELGFLVEPRELTDEQAFRLAEVDNRHRRNCPDHLRAAAYAHALAEYYGGNQSRMALRLGLSEGRLSRFLALANLPEEIVTCLGGRTNARVQHAAALAPLLRIPPAEARIRDAARELGEEQQALRFFHQPHAAGEVVRLLVEAGRNAIGRRSPITAIRDRHGIIVARGRRNHIGSLVLTIPIAGTRNRPEVLEAVAKLLDQMVGKAEE